MPTARLSRVSQFDIRADRNVAQFDNRLRSFLLGLAKLLVLAGVTPKHFGELSTRAFVEAACDLSKFRNGKINKSRVAVLTALRRAEVAKLLSSRDTRSVSSPNQPRTERVIAGWTSDRRYLDKQGRPRRLALSNGRNSFASLTRSFGGDVPHRALLKELVRLRVVRERGQHVELTIKRRASNIATRHSILRLLPVLSDGVDVALTTGVGNTNSFARRLSLSATDLVELAMLRERTATGVESFLDGLQRSLQSPRNNRRSTRRTRRGITLTVLVRENDDNLSGASR